jgi:hypothetical protein
MLIAIKEIEKEKEKYIPNLGGGRICIYMVKH